MLYVYDGFLTVLSMTPSLLKSQAYDVTVPVDWSVNCTDKGAVPETGVPVKPATGAADAVVTVI